MPINDSERSTDVILSSKTRWLAVATGCFVAVVGSLRLGLGFVSVPSFLIAGAIMQPRFPRAGRVLICAGALASSFWVLAGVFSPSMNRPTDRLGAVGLTLALVLFVALCDFAIMIEEVRIRRTRAERETEIVSVSNKVRWLAGVTGCLTAVTTSLLGPVFVIVPVCLIVGAVVAGRSPRNGRDLIWLGAVLLSLFGLPIGVWILFRNGADIRVAMGASLSVILVVLCDVALLREAVKTRRAQHADKTNIDPSPV